MEQEVQKEYTDSDENMFNFTHEWAREKRKAQNLLQKIPKKIMNRRYKKLEKLMEEGEYFTEEAIRRRQPILYHIYIGRFLREGVEPPKSFLEFLQNQSQNEEHIQRVQLISDTNPDIYKFIKDSNRKLEGAELEDAEDELIVLMHQRFLAGLDCKFVDYETIDNAE